MQQEQSKYTTLQLLNSLECLDILPKCKAKNIIVPKLLFYREIYFKVDAQMKVNGAKKTQAVKDVAVDLNVTEKVIYEALKKMSE